MRNGSPVLESAEMSPSASKHPQRFTPTLGVNRESEIPLHKQLMEQIIVLIATGRFQPGDALPTVRQLARQNGIHYNTVSRAYRELVGDGWLRRHPGRPLTVIAPDSTAAIPRDLDGVIDMTIRLARECGYTSRQLGSRLMERLKAQPDHVLVVSTDPGIEELLLTELDPRLSCRVDSWSLDKLKSATEVPLGALIVCLRGGAAFVRPHLPERWPLVSVSIGDPGEAVVNIQDMSEPSMIALVSVSPLFLQRAEGMLAPALGDLHTLQAHLLEDGKSLTLRSVDLVLCDSVAFQRVKARNRYEYRLIAPGSIDEIRESLSLAESSQKS